MLSAGHSLCILQLKPGARTTILLVLSQKGREGCHSKSEEPCI